MAGAWSCRLVKGEDGKLQFAAVRFRPMEDRISGAIAIRNSGDTVEDMRSLANKLLRACDAGVINLADGFDPDAADDGDDDDDDF